MSLEKFQDPKKIKYVNLMVVHFLDLGDKAG
jgi:hypothetical protein